MSIYRWAKLDDQSGPDRSIELKGSGQVRDHRCGHTETALARRSGADDVLACVVALALCGVQIHRRLDSIGVLRWTPHNSRGHITHTAPTVDEWRRNKRPDAFPPAPGTCVGRTVSVACGSVGRSPWSHAFPPGVCDIEVEVKPGAPPKSLQSGH